MDGHLSAIQWVCSVLYNSSWEDVRSKKYLKMTSNEADGKTTSDRKRLFQPKSQKKSGDKASLPKWFEDSRNMHDHQAKYLGKIYEMREKLINEEKKSLEHSLSRMDRQKFLANRPLQGRPRAFTSPSLLDDVKGILISRRSDVKAHTTPYVASTEGLKRTQVLQGKRICKDAAGFLYHKSIDVSDTDEVDRNMNQIYSAANDDDVLIKMAKCKNGKPGCDFVVPCRACREEPLVFDVALEKKDRNEFSASKVEEKSKNVSKRREQRGHSIDPLRQASTKDNSSHSSKSRKDAFSRLPKLSNIPRQKKYETTKKGKNSTKRQNSNSSQQSANDMTMAGKQIFIHEQVNRSEKEEFFSQIDSLESDSMRANSPTSMSPRSISPYSLSCTSVSPGSPQEFKFPEQETPLPKLSINLPPVPLNTPLTTSPQLSLSANTSDLVGDHAPVIVLRPATPYVERTENQAKLPASKGWSLWKAVKQTEIRRMELKKLIEDIKEFNTSNKSIEQRLNTVSTT